MNNNNNNTSTNNNNNNNNLKNNKMKKFLNNTQVEVNAAGFVTVKGAKEVTPVTNVDFIAAQKRAEYVITFANLAKGKDFEGKKADSLADLQAEVANALTQKDKKFVSAPKKVAKKLTKQLADEALAFMKFEEDTTKVEKVNKFLQEFTIISEFEEFGLFFDEGIVKLNKIYTMKEIIKAVESTINLLD